MTSWAWVENNPTITKWQVQKLLAYHDIRWSEFLSDFRLQDVYDSATIIAWLGY